MKRFRRIFASVFVALALVGGATAPVSAAASASVSATVDKQGVDVTKLTAKSIVVSSYHCKNTEVTMSRKQAKWVDEWSVQADVTRGGNQVTMAFFDADGDKSRTKVQVCPWVDGVGKYTIGPSSVFANSDDYLKSWYGTDWTKGSFYVREKSYATLKASRRGSKVTLSLAAKRYSVDRDEKVNYSPKKVQIQVKSGKKWKTIKTVNLKKGKAKVTIKKKGKASYRYVIKQTSTVAGATSKTVKK